MRTPKQITLYLLCLFGLCCMLCMLCIPAVTAQDEMLGPYCTKTDQTSVTINWASAESGPFTVTYASGTTPAQTKENITASSDSIAGMNIFHLRLTDLLPGTSYHYQITSPSGRSETCRVQTFPDDGTVTFAVFGDIQQSAGSPDDDRARYHQVADALSTDGNLFVLIVGDLVNDGRSDEEWTLFFDAMQPVLTNTTIYTVLGNHEKNASQYYALFGYDRWYRIKADPAEIFILDSNNEATPLRKTQTAWLENALNESEGSVFAAFHHPPYSSDAAHPGGWKNVRNLWSPALEEKNASGVFCGHVHAYERYRVNRTDYLVLGTGGAPFYNLSTEKTGGYQASLEWTLGYERVTVNGTEDSVKFAFVPIPPDGSEEPAMAFDTFEQSRSGTEKNVQGNAPVLSVISKGWREVRDAFLHLNREQNEEMR